MTKTELLKVATDAFNHTPEPKRLFKCNAYYTIASYQTNKQFTAWSKVSTLKSYDKVVAIFSHATGTCYQFEPYTQTTRNHVHRFAGLMNADRLVMLFNCRDMEFDYHIGKYRKISDKCRQNIIDSDYSLVITNYLDIII